MEQFLNILAHFLIGFGAIWNLIGEGATEGFTFASVTERVLNPIIKRHFNTQNANGFLGYHGFRVLFENIGVLIMIIGFHLIEFHLITLLYYLGIMIIGTFIYERVFNIVSYGKLFPQKSNYCILGYEIPRNKWQDIIVGIIGILILVLYFKINF